MPTTIYTDTNNQFSWATKTFEYSDTGRLLSSTFVYDGGKEIIREYLGGNLVSTNVFDLGNEADWTTQSTVVQNIDGIYTTTTETIYDDGRERLDTLFNGNFRTVEDTDVNDVANWSTRFYVYLNNQLSSSNVVMDNGTESGTNYNNDGQIANVWSQDLGNNYNWSEKTTSYSVETGKQIDIVYDDGRVYHADYAGQTRVATLEIDGGNTKNWSQREAYYDAESGSLTRMVTLQDDGINRTDEWSGNTRSTITFEDLQDNRTWDTITQSYDETGTLALRETTFDNGIERTENWSDGVRTSTVEVDTADVKPWQNQVNDYDQNGALITRFTDYDNGVDATEDFFNGKRYYDLQHDTLDVYNWTSREAYYNASGTIADRNTIFDDGVEQTEYYDASGQRNLTEAHDVADAFVWNTRSTTYSVTGQRDVTDTNFDNGDRTVIDYQADGRQVDWILEVDGNFSDDWSYRVTQFDVTGETSVVTTYDNAFEIPNPYAGYLFPDIWITT